MILLILSAGCGLTRGQKEGVSSFGDAAAILGKVSYEQFHASRSTVIQMKRMTLAIGWGRFQEEGSGAGNADRMSYQEVFSLDSGLSPEGMERRLLETEMLTAYGEMLSVFMEEPSGLKFHTAGRRFMDSVRGFPDNPLSAEQIDRLGTQVAVPASLMMEREKKESVRRIIPAVSPLIQRLCDNLERDYDVGSDGVASILDLAQNHLAGEAVEGMKGGVTGIGDFLILIDGLTLANDTKASLEKFSGKGLKAVAAMREADRRLVELVTGQQGTVDEVRSIQFGDVTVRHVTRRDDIPLADEIISFARNVDQFEKSVRLFIK